MKPYYRKNGFFDLSERLSLWIDERVEDLLYEYECYGIFRFLPGKRCETIANNHFCVWRGIRQVDMYKRFLEMYKEDYNREKYFWMAKK